MLSSKFRLPSMCEQSAVDTAKHSRLGRSHIRFRYSLFSPLTRKNSHSGYFFSVNYRLRSSVGERGISVPDVAGWIRLKGTKRKDHALRDLFFLSSPNNFEPFFKVNIQSTFFRPFLHHRQNRKTIQNSQHSK